MNADYDIAIIGGGLVGATLALALAHAEFKVALIEEGGVVHYEADEWGCKPRVSAINPFSEKLFRHLGLWEVIQARAYPYREMCVWDAAGNGEIHFNAAEFGQFVLGYIIENEWLLAAIHAQLMREKSLDVFWGDGMSNMQSVTSYCTKLNLASGKALTAALLVGADGANSRVRSLAGINIYKKDYHQLGLVAVVEISGSHRQTAWQRFLPEGPLAFLPLSKGKCSIVWSTTPVHAEWLRLLPEKNFCEELTAASAMRLGEIKAAGPRVHFPLSYMQAETYAQPGMVLVGDAAHIVHPLAGLGVNLGLQDVACLLDSILEARSCAKPINSFSTLKRYARQRRNENQIMLSGLDALKQLFASRNPVVSVLRNTSLNWTDRFRPLKRFFMWQAMGTDMRIPGFWGEDGFKSDVS